MESSIERRNVLIYEEWQSGSTKKSLSEKYGIPYSRIDTIIRSTERRLSKILNGGNKKMISSIFRDIGLRSQGMSPLMDNRSEMKRDEVLEKKELTIIGFDLIPSGENIGDYQSIIIFKEIPDKYLRGTNFLTRVCQLWVKEFNNDIIVTNTMLKSVGGVEITLGQSMLFASFV